MPTPADLARVAAEFRAAADWSADHGWTEAAADLRDVAAVFGPPPAPDEPPHGH